jgi:small subunit ribosomal protein S6
MPAGQAHRKEASLRDQARAPRKYELMTILHPEVAEESLPGELDRISGFITAAGGELIETLQDSPWGRRRLAYPIRSGGRDVRDGYYTVWHFTLGPTRVDDLERELKLDTQLIRYIVLSWEPTPIDPKAVEAAEIAAEDAAAAAYVAAQAAAAAAEDDAAEAYAAAQSAAATAEPEAAEATSALEPVSAEEERAEVLDAAATAVDASMRLAAEEIRGDELTAEAEALEASGAELAIEPVAAIAEREQLEADAAAALAIVDTAATEAAAPEATTADAGTDVPEGAMRGDGTGECPEDYPIKGNATSKLYHSPGSPSYKRTVPEFCFASTEAAEAAGFNPTKYEAAHEETE